MPDIRYLLTTLDPQPGGTSIQQPIAEIPFTQVTFSLCWNQAGPFSATINVEDPQVLNTNWIDGTNPGKTFWWVVIGNECIYGGRILTRIFQESTQQVVITGADFYSYWTQRLQAVDYTQFFQTYSAVIYDWAATPPDGGVPAPLAAWQILQDAAAVSGSLPNLTVPAHGLGVGTASDPDYWVANYLTGNWISFSSPQSQQQSIDSLLQQFSGMGGAAPGAPFDGIGVDVVTAVSLDTNGNPKAETVVCWPRFGTSTGIAGPETPVMDLSSAIDFQWSEDATSQATGIIEQTGQGGVMTAPELIDTVAIGTYNYPFTEQAISHISTSPTALSQAVLATLAVGDRDLYAYPQLAPVVTVPAFSFDGFDLTRLPIGDDVILFNPFELRPGQRSIPIPQPGISIVLRMVRADVTIADSGVSTMQLTFNPPPGAPSPPGAYD